MNRSGNLINRAMARSVIAIVIVLSGCALAPEAPPVRQEVIAYPPDEPRFYYERAIISSADVTEDERGAGFRRMMTGEAISGEGMGKPYGLAVQKGRLYVSDTVRKEVLLFDIPAKQFKLIGNDEPGRLAMPLGLDVDAAGNLYVADGTLRKVMIYDRSGKYLRSLGEGQLNDRPSGIAVDSAGNRVYIVETGGVSSVNHRVRVFDGKTGQHLFDIGKRGSADGEFNLPRDAVLAPNGRLYVVDGGNFRVQVFEPDGKFIRSFGEVGQQTGQFSRPKELDVDREGNLYVVDTAFGNFQIFDSEGRLLLNVGGRSAANEPGKFMLPSGIAVDEDGRVYMVDQYHRKVEVFRPAALDSKAGFTAPMEVRK